MDLISSDVGMMTSFEVRKALDLCAMSRCSWAQRVCTGGWVGTNVPLCTGGGRKFALVPVRTIWEGGGTTKWRRMELVAPTQISLQMSPWFGAAIGLQAWTGQIEGGDQLTGHGSYALATTVLYQGPSCGMHGGQTKVSATWDGSHIVVGAPSASPKPHQHVRTCACKCDAMKCVVQTVLARFCFCTGLMEVKEHIKGSCSLPFTGENRLDRTPAGPTGDAYPGLG